MSKKTYSIVRFYRDREKDNEVINTGFSLKQAQKHCSDKATSTSEWFDGYTEEEKEE